MQKPNNLSTLIHTHRKASGLTLLELAQLAGVGKTVVFDLEHGKESVRFDTLQKILHALNIRIQFLSPLETRP